MNSCQSRQYLRLRNPSACARNQSVRATRLLLVIRKLHSNSEANRSSCGKSSLGVTRANHCIQSKTFLPSSTRLALAGVSWPPFWSTIWMPVVTNCTASFCSSTSRQVLRRSGWNRSSELSSATYGVSMCSRAASTLPPSPRFSGLTRTSIRLSSMLRARATVSSGEQSSTTSTLKLP